MPRAYHATVALDGAIYMIGGFDGTQYYNSVKRFDAVEKTWQEVAPMYHQVKLLNVLKVILNDSLLICTRNLIAFLNHFLALQN